MSPPRDPAWDTQSGSLPLSRTRPEWVDCAPASGIQKSARTINLADEDAGGDDDGMQPGEWDAFVHRALG